MCDKYFATKKNIIIKNGNHALIARKLSKIGKTDDDMEPAQAAKIKTIAVSRSNVFDLTIEYNIYIALILIPSIKT